MIKSSKDKLGIFEKVRMSKPANPQDIKFTKKKSILFQEKEATQNEVDNIFAEESLTIKKDQQYNEQPKPSDYHIDQVNQFLTDFTIECPKDIHYQDYFKDRIKELESLFLGEPIIHIDELQIKLFFMINRFEVDALKLMFGSNAIKKEDIIEGPLEKDQFLKKRYDFTDPDVQLQNLLQDTSINEEDSQINRISNQVIPNGVKIANPIRYDPRVESKFPKYIIRNVVINEGMDIENINPIHTKPTFYPTNGDQYNHGENIHYNPKGGLPKVVQRQFILNEQNHNFFVTNPRGPQDFDQGPYGTNSNGHLEYYGIKDRNFYDNRGSQDFDNLLQIKNN